MSETRHFGLTLLAAAQAQKHVTLNEALTRLDTLAAGLVESASTAVPPVAPGEGDVFIVPQGASTAWTAPEGALCAWLNGGWLSFAARPGQRVWVRDRVEALEHDGSGWYPAGSVAALDGHAAFRALTLDHDLADGPQTATAIPDKAVVFGVTGRVLAPVTGAALTGWRLGVPGGAGRYGSGYGLGAGSWASGVTGSPVAYYGATPLLVEGEGGPVTGGTIRLCVHCVLLTPPAMP